ncbi:putative 26S proteasome non-ATPase regulatory subunit 8 B [Arabidopsis thaliana]
MDPQLMEVSQQFERFKAAFIIKDFDTCSSLLSQLKLFDHYLISLSLNALLLLTCALFFLCTRNRIPPSPQENLIMGLNLLRLLVQNRIAEFHTELGLLSSATLENPCIKHAVELEQSFMEGAYNRVLSARQTAPDETYVYFMDLLAKTIRDEIAGCSEKAYDHLSISEGCKMLLFSSDQQLLTYVNEEHPEWEVKDG